MGISLLTTADTIMCPHGASVTHPPSQVRVKVNGAPVLVLADLGTVAGCPFQLPGPTPSPCLQVQWLVGATRVRVNGQFVLLKSSSGLCKSPQQAPQGPPNPTVVQMRVTGT